jgi:hypothetical protein
MFSLFKKYKEKKSTFIFIYLSSLSSYFSFPFPLVFFLSSLLIYEQQQAYFSPFHQNDSSYLKRL